jgi:hypothetical protein
MNNKEIESLAFQLANTFLRYYKKIRKKHFKISNIKNTNWWIHFIQTIINFGNRELFDIEQFVKAQFEDNEKVLPFELTREEAYQNFLSRRKDDVNPRKKTVEEIISMYKLVKKWCILNIQEDKFDIKSFLKDKRNIYFLMRGAYSPSLFCFSKSFIDLNKDHRILTDEEIDAKRSVILTNEKISNKLKEILKDEFYTGSV